MNIRAFTWSATVMAVTAVGAGGVVPAVAQSAAPRTAWGKPDLQGIWDFRTITPL